MITMFKNIVIGGVGLGLGILVDKALAYKPPTHHAELIAQCSVTDTTLGIALQPLCIWGGTSPPDNLPFSVWVWITDHNIEMFCLIADWIDQEGTPMIGIEWSRSGYNVFEVIAKDKTVIFPFVTELPAIGYWTIGWPR